MKYYSKETGALAYNSESEYLESQLKTYLEEIEECDLDDYPSFKEWIENDDAWTFDVEDEDREWSDEACERFGELCEKYNGQYEAWVVMDSENAVISDEFRTKDELLDSFPPLDVEEANATVCRVLCNKGSWLECLEELTPDEL